MKQIKGILLFLMSIVLVAFGSQNSRSSKNLVKQLEDETKKVGNKMKESELQAKKEEQKKQGVQPKQTVAANPAQQQQPVQNVQSQQSAQQPQKPGLAPNDDASKQALALAAENDNLNGKTGNKKNKKNKNYLNGKNELYKAPKHSRLKNKSSFVSNEKPTKVKSQDSAPKPSSNSGSSSSGSSSSGASSSGGDSSSSE